MGVEETPDEVAGDAIHGKLRMGMLEGGVMPGFKQRLRQGILALTLLLEQAGLGIRRARYVQRSHNALGRITSARRSHKVIIGLAKQVYELDSRGSHGFV